MIFLRISRNFQSLLFWEIKEKERTFCAEAPGRSFLLAETPLAGVEAGERRAAGFRHLGRPAAGGRISAPGAAGGEGEHGEKHKGGERNLLMALVGRGAA